MDLFLCLAHATCVPMEALMLEATRILATTTKYTDEQLEGIAYEFGDDWPMQCIIPVGALIHARREYENFKRPQDAVTSCARVVATAEAFLDACGNDPLITAHPAREWREPFLALSREIDNLRNRVRPEGKEPTKRKMRLDKMTLPPSEYFDKRCRTSADRVISGCVDILRSNTGRTAATKAGPNSG